MKKFLVGAVAAAAMVFPMSAGATTYPDGDANCSGTVTMADANLVLATYLQKPGIPEVPGWCGAKVDMNCSGTITPLDALTIQRIYLQQAVSSGAC